jgi:uncharacterized membrane protein
MLHCNLISADCWLKYRISRWMLIEEPNDTHKYIMWFFLNVPAGVLCRSHYGGVVIDIRLAAKHAHVLCKFITGT